MIFRNIAQVGDRVKFLPCRGRNAPELTLHVRNFLPVVGPDSGDQSAAFGLRPLIREFRYALQQASTFNFRIILVFNGRFL